MKICPFCKKEIAAGSEKCPHCNHTLIERSFTSTAHSKQQNSTAQNAGFYQPHKFNITAYINKSLTSIKNFLCPKKVQKFGQPWWKKYKGYLPLLISILLIVILNWPRQPTTIKYSGTPVPVIPSEQVTKDTTPPNQPEQAPAPAKDPKTYVSLNNGALLAKNSNYLRGAGKLKIDNGTGSDAIAKLVNLISNKSIYTVYVKSNSVFTIGNISDGNYKLFFNLGNDWDKTLRAFTANSSYEVFEDSFDFVTTKTDEGDYINTQYTTFNVTLNPVVNGQAKTDNIDPTQFGSY